MTATPGALRELSPTGSLRVALNLSNAALVRRTADGDLDGLAPDLARALAARLGVPVAFVAYPSGGAILADLGAGAWDAAFLPVDPARGDRLIFSRPFAEVEATFAARPDCPLRHAGDADRAGVTIATARGAAYELHLARTYTRAVLVSHETPAAALYAVRAGACDLAAGTRVSLEKAALTAPPLRVLDGAFLTVPQAIAVPRGHREAAAFLSEAVTASGGTCRRDAV